MKRIHLLEMNKYVKVDIQSLLISSNKWITNGVNNEYFYTVEDAYLGSPTNQSIIDNFTNYILGEGLEDTTGSIDVESILSEEDLRNAVTDFKLQGACAFQVIYNFGGGINKLYYVPTKSLAVNKEEDITDDVRSYWYSFDWRFRTRYKPVEYPSFGCGNGLQTEILYIKRQSAQPVYALPDWQSGIQYCQTEEELSNYYNKHIKNNFSAGKIININQGTTDSEEAMEEAEKAILNKVAGSNNAGNVIISFNDNFENRTTVDTIPIENAYEQFQFLSQECLEKIMLAHKVNDKSLFGLPMPSGFSSVAEQMVQSLKILYRSQINPSRRILTTNLEKALRKNNPNVKLKFIDFEELQVVKEPVAIPEPVLQQNDMDANKVSFDYDDTLTTDKGIKMLEEEIALGKTIYVISARYSKDGMLSLTNKYGIDSNRVYATGSNKSKIEKVLELNIGTHYDNNQDVVNGLPGIGKII
jgi:hypothetical protein